MASVAQRIKTTTKQYTDLDLSLTKHPVTGDIAIKSGDNAVITSVRNLIMTNFYERPYHPEIGSGVTAMLFENATPLTAQYLKKMIEDVITNFEPRAALTNVTVTVYPEQNYFEVKIGMYINNNSSPTNLTVFLERTR